MGSFYANPDLFLDYSDLIIPEYDFKEKSSRFLYESLHELYHYQAKGSITESKINIYMNQDPIRKEKYNFLKGYATIKRFMDIADLDEFENYYSNLKKYSLLREFERNGFPAKAILENKKFASLSPEDIIDAMEYKISTIGTVIGGVEDSVILGANMVQKVKNWKLKPDFGLPIPWDIINNLIRGLRDKKFNLIGMHSGCGKSRTTSKIACYVGILLGIPLFVGANEQDENEWDAMVLSCVINNPEFGFLPMLHKAGLVGIDETKIVTGTYDDIEEEIVMAAAQYIEDNSKIYFKELGKFDENTLKREIKRHKIRGCQLIIYDTMKAPDHDWMSFVKTGDMMKEIAKELSISMWATFQLTDDSLFNELLTSQAIASGKHIKHIADGLIMARPVFAEEYDKYMILKADQMTGELKKYKLDKSIVYYVFFVDKNRGGRDKDQIILRVDKGMNVWVEEGYFVKSDDEQEYQKIKKEHKKLKQEKEVLRLRQEVKVSRG